jgi:hypothetical protein
LSVLRKRPATSRLPIRSGALTTGLGVAAAALALVPGSASAVPAYGLLNCTGNLAKEKGNVAEPFLTSYQFQCTQDIASYTVIVSRQPNNFNTIDNFNSTPSVLDPTNTVISSTVTATCQGITPGNGFNCAAASPTKPQSIPTTDWVQGDFDTLDPFCSFYRSGAKPGSTPVPSANAQLIVSDLYGNEFGPFQLPIKPGCKAPPKPKSKGTKGSTKSGSKGKGVTKKHKQK